MKKYVESYKITATGIQPKRRETIEGAKALAKKLQAKGKHGEIEMVWVVDNTLEFETVAKF